MKGKVVTLSKQITVLAWKRGGWVPLVPLPIEFMGLIHKVAIPSEAMDSFYILSPGSISSDHCTWLFQNLHCKLTITWGPGNPTCIKSFFLQCWLKPSSDSIPTISWWFSLPLSKQHMPLPMCASGLLCLEWSYHGLQGLTSSGFVYLSFIYLFI